MNQAGFWKHAKSHLSFEWAFARSAGVRKSVTLIAAALLRRLVPRSEELLHRQKLRIGLAISSQPLHIRLATSDRNVFKQVWLDQEYAPVAHLPSIVTIVDCGANIGLTSAYLLSHYPQATLLAVEAEGRNAAVCRENLQPYSDRACVLQAGIWRNGTWDHMIPLVLDQSLGDGREWAFSVKEAANSMSFDVLGIGLAAICGQLGGIDLLKVDIEGSEAVLFSDGCEAWLPKVRNIAIELHGSESSRVFFHALREYDFELLEQGELTFATNLRRRPSMQ